MSLVNSLSPYNFCSDGMGKSSGSGGSRPGSPDMQLGDVPMSEDEVANKIPLQNLKSNQMGQKEIFIDPDAGMEGMSEQMSPGVGRRHIDF